MKRDAGAPAAPQKEYGYRGGELLVTAGPSARVRRLVFGYRLPPALNMT